MTIKPYKDDQTYSKSINETKKTKSADNDSIQKLSDNNFAKFIKKNTKFFNKKHNCNISDNLAINSSNFKTKNSDLKRKNILSRVKKNPNKSMVIEKKHFNATKSKINGCNNTSRLDSDDKQKYLKDLLKIEKKTEYINICNVENDLTDEIELINTFLETTFEFFSKNKKNKSIFDEFFVIKIFLFKRKPKNLVILMNKNKNLCIDESHEKNLSQIEFLYILCEYTILKFDNKIFSANKSYKLLLICLNFAMNSVLPISKKSTLSSDVYDVFLVLNQTEVILKNSKNCKNMMKDQNIYKCLHYLSGKKSEKLQIFIILLIKIRNKDYIYDVKQYIKYYEIFIESIERTCVYDFKNNLSSEKNNVNEMVDSRYCIIKKISAICKSLYDSQENKDEYKKNLNDLDVHCKISIFLLFRDQFIFIENQIKIDFDKKLKKIEDIFKKNENINTKSYDNFRRHVCFKICNYVMFYAYLSDFFSKYDKLITEQL